MLNFFRTAQRNTLNINDSVRIKLLKILRDHKFRHGFIDTLNPLCPCSTGAGTTTHYFLCYHFYNTNRKTLIYDLNEIDSSFFTLNKNKLIGLFLNGSDKFGHKRNHSILMSTIRFSSLMNCYSCWITFYLRRAFLIWIVIIIFSFSVQRWKMSLSQGVWFRCNIWFFLNAWIVTCLVSYVFVHCINFEYFEYVIFLCIYWFRKKICVLFIRKK